MVVKEEMDKALGEFSKSCVTKEYVVNDVLDYGPFSTHMGQRGFSIGIYIALPSSTNNAWTNQIFKTVRQEYYVMTMVGLIGTVGGTLGLFVGLNFMDSGNSIINMIKKSAFCIFGRKAAKRDNFLT